MISAIILAAGLSKRMKLGNKLLLEKNNTTIIQETIKRVQASSVNEVIVVLGKDHKIFKKKINDNTINYVTNKSYSSGIASSIKKGLEKVNKRNLGVMICLGDMPLIKSSTYIKIINEFHEKNKNIIPCFKLNAGNPVLFKKIYYRELMKIKGDEGAKFLIKKTPEHFYHLEVNDQGILKDIDNSYQYYSFLKDA